MRDDSPLLASSGPTRLLAGIPHRDTVLRVTLVLMVAVAAIRVPLEVHRLLLDTGVKGAIDLRIISGFVKGWFSDPEAVTTYPPASHILLWPFMGWLPLNVLRWVWMASVVPLLAWLVVLLERAAGLEARGDRAWFRLFVVASYATAIVIGNGQLALHVLPALLAGILLLEGDRVGPGKELLATVLLLLAMSKPSLAVPFFWVALFACGAVRVVLASVVAYLGLSALAVALRPVEAGAATVSWLATASGIEGGYANLQAWSRVAGVGEYDLALSLGLLGLAGLWILARRRADLWVLLGVAAIVARIWTYHRLYDDVLLFIPVVALIRIARLEAARERNLHLVAGVLVLALWVGLMGPGTLLRSASPLGTVYRVAQILTWTGTLGFLMYWAEDDGIRPRR